MKGPRNEDLFASVIALHDCPGAELTTFLRELTALLQARFSDYEIVVITARTRMVAAEVDAALSTIPHLRVVTMARTMRRDLAFAAGLELAIGDCVALTEPSRDPPADVVRALEMCCEGNDVVVGSAPERRTLGAKVATPLLNALVSRFLPGYRPLAHQTPMRCLSRAAVNAITESGRFHHQLTLRVYETGYEAVPLPYERRPGTRPRRLRQELGEAVHLVVFGSTSPLRIMSGFGVLGSLVAFLFAAYSIAVRFFKDSVIEGWTTIVLFSSVLFMLLFTILAFFGEYLGRLLDDEHGQRHYNVASERHSNVMVDEARRNVVDVSAGSEES